MCCLTYSFILYAQSTLSIVSIPPSSSILRLFDLWLQVCCYRSVLPFCPLPLVFLYSKFVNTKNRLKFLFLWNQTLRYEINVASYFPLNPDHFTNFRNHECLFSSWIFLTETSFAQMKSFMQSLTRLDLQKYFFFSH